MNKMTIKEFIEILKHVGIDFNKYGYEYILVFVERVFWAEAEDYSEKYPITAKDTAEKARYIHKVLKDHGYYDNTEGK